jgi:hypothetical protein
MDHNWYFLDGDLRKGPFSTADLLSALLVTPDPRLAKVWREGLPDWERAGTQPELAGKLPPRVPSTRPQTAGTVTVATPAETVAAVGRLYRRLVLLVGVQWIIAVMVNVLVPPNPSDVEALFGIVGFAATVTVLVFMLVTAYGLTKRIESGVPILWAAGMLIPLVNILVLLAISSKAQAWCRSRGIPVGFWGPKKDHLPSA